MPTVRINADLEMHYEVDDYTDPWGSPETVLMLHGNAERGQVWYGWVPHLARHFRVVRPDMRGFGESTPMPRDFPWTLDVLIDDYMTLMRSLGVERFHLVGAKLGGTIARAFAARRPEHVLSLTVAGTPAPLRSGVVERLPAMIKSFETEGVEPWARSNMGNRLGDRFPAEGAEWWCQLMGRTDANTQIGFCQTIACADIREDLPRIQCPTLVITTEGSALGSVQETREWQQAIPRSELLVLPGNSYHVSASDPDLCAEACREFILRNRQENA